VPPGCTPERFELTHSEDAYNELCEALSEDPLGRLCSVESQQCHAALRGDTPLVWTVDLNQTRIFYDREGLHLVHEFSLPWKGPLRLRHFQTYIPAELPPQICKQSSMICSHAAAPRDVVPKTLYDLVYRMVTDYEHNWRGSGLTVERYGMHHLAMGILSCFTLNFEVQKIGWRNTHLHPYLTRVRSSNLLRWRVWPSPQVLTTVSLGATQVIFTERMDLATSMVHEHFATLVLGDLYNLAHELGVEESGNTPFYVKVQYVVTSLREIQCFSKVHSKGESTMTCTPVQDFFDGANPPSEVGVRWLLNSIHGHKYPLHTPIHDLPLEIQEMILEYACPSSSYNVLDRAIFSAQLDLGLPFNFQQQSYPFRSCELSDEREMDPGRSEYQVRIWGDYVGMTYQLDDGHERVQFMLTGTGLNTPAVRRAWIARQAFNSASRRSQA